MPLPVEPMGPMRSKNMNGFQWTESNYFLKIFTKKFHNVHKVLCEATVKLFAAVDANDITSPPLWYRHGDLSAPLYHFFQGEDNSIERGEKHYVFSTAFN